MNTTKRLALEQVGWRFGSAEEFLADTQEKDDMTIDEERAHLLRVFSEPGVYSVHVSKEELTVERVIEPEPPIIDHTLDPFVYMISGLLIIGIVIALPVWLPLLAIGWVANKLFN